MPELVIRPFERQDADAVLALYRELHSHHEAAVPHLSELDAGPADEAALLERTDKPAGIFLVGCLNGMVVAMLHGTMGESSSPFLRPHLLFSIHTVTVTRAHREQGIGRKLTEQALALAKVAGAHAVELSAFSFNEPAIGLYRSLGFEPWITRLRQSLS